MKSLLLRTLLVPCLAGCAALIVAGAAGAAELRGHGGPVRAIAVTADGESAVTGSFDSSAIVWSLKTGAARQVLRFHLSQVTAVAALPDGRFATAGEDGRIALWRLGETAPASVLAGHGGPVAALAVSPDGALLASASWDHSVRVWPLAGGEPRVLEGHSDSVNAVAFLADGTLASGGYDARILFRPAGGKGPATRVTLESPVNTLVVLPGDRLAVGSADGRVRIVDRKGGVQAEATVAETPVIALAVSRDGRHLAAAGLKGAIAVLEAEGLKPVHNLVGPGLPVWSLAFSADGATLLSGGSDRVVRSWDVASGEHQGAIVAGLDDPLARFEGERGAEVFRACVACHTLSPDEGNRAGPSLAGLFGRRIATLPGYHFSEALKGLDIVWTPQTVAKLFEIGPATYTPGTKMPEQRIGSPADREALVRFLQKATRAD
jgi:cytochrome c